MSDTLFDEYKNDYDRLLEAVRRGDDESTHGKEDDIHRRFVRDVASSLLSGDELIRVAKLLELVQALPFHRFCA